MDAEATTTPKRVPWDSDHATADGPSSLDVLLSWMLTPGKYERLHGEQRAKAVLNILSVLRKNGIDHRSESGIRSKVRLIENQYLAAKKWLEGRNINGDDVVNGAVDTDTEQNVLALCPQFRELMPVLHHSCYLNELATSRATDTNGGGDEAMDSVEKAKAARTKAKRKAREEIQRSCKRHQTTSIEDASMIRGLEGGQGHTDAARIMNCRRTATYGKLNGNELDLSGAQDWFERTDHCELVIRDPSAQLPSEFQRQIAEVKLDYVKKHSQAVLANDEKLRLAMTECDIEVKRGRSQVQLLLEMMLARQTMKERGVPQKQIDSVMPLEEP